MWEKAEIYFFRKNLLDWFIKNGRKFPWREADVSNYQLILSEILLQRTQAETVARFYNSFFTRYPGWEQLTAASVEDLEDVLKPLGLYRHRAKRIYRIARDYQKRQGILPKNVNELQESSLSALYISNAFELFVLKRRAALLDINMSRLLSRFFYPKPWMDVRNDKIIQELSREVTNVKKCRELNWAILDYASLICRSSRPLCDSCFLQSRCRYNQVTKDSEK